MLRTTYQVVDRLGFTMHTGIDFSREATVFTLLYRWALTLPWVNIMPSVRACTYIGTYLYQTTLLCGQVLPQMKTCPRLV